MECLPKKGILKNACLLQLAKVWCGVCIGVGKEGKGEEGKRGKGGKKARACRLNKNNIRQEGSIKQGQLKEDRGLPPE